MEPQETEDRSLVQVVGDYFLNGAGVGHIYRMAFNATRREDTPELEPEVRTPRECEPAAMYGGLMALAGCTLTQDQRADGAPRTPTQRTRGREVE